MLQAIAAIAWGATGIATCHTARGDWRKLALGIGLVTGAAMQALDGFSAVGATLPFAALGLLALATLRRLTVQRSTSSLVAYAVFTALSLHWLHSSLSPTSLASVFGLQPWTLATGAAFVWLAMRNPNSHLPGEGDVAARWIYTTLGVGMIAASPCGSLTDSMTAAVSLLAIAPAIIFQITTARRTFTTALATSFAAAFALLVRASAASEGLDLQLAGVTDAMLVTAAMFVAFGIALLRENDVATLSNPEWSRLLDEAEQEKETAQSEVEQHQKHQLSTHAILRDLRDPLTSLLATATLARSDLEEEEQQVLLLQLRTFGKQMGKTMADIDDLESLINGEIDLADEALDLPKVLRECVDEMLPDANAREVDICFDPSTTLPKWQQGDPERTRQLLSRLLHLASNRCTIGPIHVSASADEEHVHINLLNHHAGVVDSERTGVRLVQELATAMNGSLTLRTRDSGGTEFHLQLPRRQPEDWEIQLQELDQGISNPESPLADSIEGDVLLITDNQDHQRLIASLLTDAGASVATADSGLMAVHMMGARPFALVLIDMELPGCEGINTVRDLRDHERQPPILAISSDCNQANIERYLSAGCNGYLAKPIDDEVLRRALALHLTAAP